MIRALFLIILAGAAALTLIWATQTFTGQILIPMGEDAVIEVNIVFAVVGLILAGGLIAVLWAILGSIYNLPQTFSRGRKKKAEQRAETALTEGLLAAEAGDTDAAVRLTKKALGGTSDPRLQILLEARAAESAGLWNQAEAHWARLAEMPGGQLAGLRGAANAAAERGDNKAAEERTRSALHLNTAAEWPFHSLFDFQVSRADWSGAMETLSIGKKRKLLDDTHAQRRLAVLLTVCGRKKNADGETRDATTLFNEAVKIAPKFPPAIFFSAQQNLKDGKFKAARSALETGWQARPHPAFAQIWRQIDALQKPKTSTISTLMRANPTHAESQILDAEDAIENDDLTRATEILETLSSQLTNHRICQMAAGAYDALDRKDKATNWRRLALTAPRDADWSDMDPTGNVFDFSDADWARLVYEYGDRGEMIHVRNERFENALEAPKPIVRLEHKPDAPEVPPAPPAEDTKPKSHAPKTWEDT